MIIRGTAEDGELIFECSADEFFASNELDEEERGAILAALAAGQALRLGGGAAPICDLTAVRE